MFRFPIWPSIMIGAFAGIAATGALCAQNAAPNQAFDRCKAMDGDSLRLSCLRSILRDNETKAGASVGRDNAPRWRLVQTVDAQSDRKAMSIMRTAETIRSDPDLAGLMIRCRSRLRDGSPNLEVLVVLLNPLPLRSHPEVRLKSENSESRYTASIAVPGALVLLPAEAAALATGSWQSVNELTIEVEDAGQIIRGVVTLGGLRSALSDLSASCPRDPVPLQ
jgi:hypothetical protein